MELVWLIVQALMLCTALLAVTCGLMFAPWYILLAALGVVLVVIQQLMSQLKGAYSSEPEIPVGKENSAIARPDSLTKRTQLAAIKPLPIDPHSTHLVYRGVDYVPSQDMEALPIDLHSTHLVYRGVDYVPSQDMEALPIDPHSTHHLVYRGADYVLSQDGEEQSV